MRKIFVFILMIVLYQSLLAQSITRLDNKKISGKDLDKKVTYLMNAAKVTGMAITVFNHNEAVYKKTFGYRRNDTKELININSNIYGASLSKVVFAVLVMKLVEEGLIDLDMPLQDYLDKPVYEYKPLNKWHDDYSDLRNDSLYRKITARMCLDHTAGFPNWRWFEPDQKLRVKFEPGSKYSYSGEGLVYLQVVIERKLGKKLEDLMHKYVFDPLGMNMSSYTWQPRFEKDYCVGHNSKGELYEKDKDNEARSASTLETTLEDYSIFTAAVLKNKVLKPGTTMKMFTTQVRIRSIQQFTELSLRDSTANDAIELGYGLGWGLLKSPYGIGAFKEGHGDGFQHYSIIFPEKGLGIVIMTNSDNGESVFKELLEYAIGDTYTPWYWQNYIPYNYRNAVK